MLEPQKHTLDTIWGHEAARRLVPRLMGQGRLPHALLLTGPDGVGKRSLAFAIAKAILSAGRPSSVAKLTAPAPAGAKRRVPDESADGGDAFGDDLFGGSSEDIFADEPDLFAAADEPDLFAEQTTDAPPSQPVESQAPPAEREPLAAEPARSSAALHRPFVGYDERVCRLVETAYPAEYDKDGRAKNAVFMDLTIIEPIGGRRGIVVDQIRSLQDIARTAPIEGAYRVVLIFGADSITQEGGNSILKLLEEPPPYLVMILTADLAHRVLPTIRSRCSTVPLAPLDQEKLLGHLVENEKLSRELASVAGSLSEGRPGVALSIVGTDLLNKRRQVFEARLQLDRFGWCALAAAAARINAAGKLDQNLWLMLSFCRDRLVNALAPGQDKLLVHRDLPDLVGAKGSSPEELDLEADRIIDAYARLQHPFVPNSRAVLQQVLWKEA